MNEKTLNYKRTKLACYASYFTMSSVFSLPPVLFMTFRQFYGISYTLLGTLVLTNFCTQLLIDLIFTLFSKYFNVKKVIRVMPLITTLGLTVYALVPWIFPSFAYGGLLIGTIIFSVSAGLSEALLSPVMAKIPSDNPQRDMSKLHSLYAFGVFTVVVISTLFIKFIGAKYWNYLTLFFALLPIIASVLFFLSPVPEMNLSEQGKEVERSRQRTLSITLCVLCIFFGSCAENAMSNWVSGYMENALKVDKALGDIIGMAGFAILLGVARILYAKKGKNIKRVLLIGMVGAFACYIVSALVSNTAVVVIACIFTGLFTSMLWPGTLIMMEEEVPSVGVSAYALMAAGGDFGASLAPQLLGVVTDKVAQSSLGAKIATSVGLSAEQVGLKAGMLVTSLFPLIGIVVLIIAIKHFAKIKKQSNSIKTLIEE